MSKQKITIEVEANAMEAATIKANLEKLVQHCDTTTLSLLGQKCDKDKSKINNKIQKNKRMFLLF